MEFSSNHHSNTSSVPSLVATLRADDKPNTQAVIPANVQHLIERAQAIEAQVVENLQREDSRIEAHSRELRSERLDLLRISIP